MSCDNEFLADVYRASRTGAETLDNLISKTESNEIQEELKREKKVYRDFQNKTLRELRNRKEKPKPISKMQRRMSKMGISMNTMFDKSQSHIADIVIQGNNMGIIGVSKTINSHKNTDAQAMALANELVDIQKENIDNLLKYL